MAGPIRFERTTPCLLLKLEGKCSIQAELRAHTWDIFKKVIYKTTEHINLNNILTLQKSMKYMLLLLILGTLLLSACSPEEEPIVMPESEPPEPPSSIKCFNYTRNEIAEEQCAECGNNICESFEKCTSSSCTIETCTDDCGPLYCPDDCKFETAKEPPNRLPEMTSYLRTCNVDSDCIIVQSDCCGCNQGGKADTIHQKHKESWEKTVRIKCEGTLCTQAISNHWSCFAEAECIKNKCTLVK
jgi:hypothetical protein